MPIEIALATPTAPIRTRMMRRQKLVRSHSTQAETTTPLPVAAEVTVPAIFFIVTTVLVLLFVVAEGKV